MIPATGIEDQELSVASEGTSVNNPAVTRGCDLCTGPGGQRNAFFHATCSVGTAEIANPGAINRISEESLGGGKGNRGAEPGGVLQSPQIRLAVWSGRGAFEAGRRGRLGGTFQVLLHLGDQALQAVDLFGQRNGAGAPGSHVFFDRALLALALVDQGCEPDLIVVQPVAIDRQPVAFRCNGLAKAHQFAEIA